METEKITRAYLETLSFSDLEAFADEYGIDIPKDLDRRFVIEELLEIASENSDEAEDMIISSDAVEDNENISETLPNNYNETQISCILRNPVWAFVFWNISENDMVMLKSKTDYSLMLRVCSLVSKDELIPEEAFEILAYPEIPEQYVLLPKDKKFIKIELVYVSGTSKSVLAFTPVIEIPEASKAINEFQPGKDNNYPEIIKLSGMEKILMNQYTNHRHSF